MSKAVPREIADYLESVWPYKFRAAHNGKGTATKQDLQLFAAQLGKILDKGVSTEQIMAALVALRNQPGGIKKDRGEILKRLWELVPKREAAKPEPTDEPAASIFFAQDGPYRLYATDPARAVEMYPWLHKPITVCGREYRRAVDAPFFKSMLSQVRGIQEDCA